MCLLHVRVFCAGWDSVTICYKRVNERWGWVIRREKDGTSVSQSPSASGIGYSTLPHSGGGRVQNMNRLISRQQHTEIRKCGNMVGRIGRTGRTAVWEQSSHTLVNNLCNQTPITGSAHIYPSRERFKRFDSYTKGCDTQVRGHRPHACRHLHHSLPILGALSIVAAVDSHRSCLSVGECELIRTSGHIVLRPRQLAPTGTTMQVCGYAEPGTVYA